MNIEDSFIKEDIEKLDKNIFSLIDKEWMLITAGEEKNLNMMTASWGTFGILWNKPVAICFIRPQRYTYEFVEKYDYYTLCFFNEEYKDILKLCGTKSGRDIDKLRETSLKIVTTNQNNIGYEQANIILECKKLYFGDIKPENFVVSEVEKTMYPEKDHHRFYIGEIENYYKKKEEE